MSDWEVTKLILTYSFWITISIWFSLAVIVRVVIDYITYFSSWFDREPDKNSLQKYLSYAISYEGEFKERVMAKALLRMAREIDQLKGKTK